METKENDLLKAPKSPKLVLALLGAQTHRSLGPDLLSLMKHLS